MRLRLLYCFLLGLSAMAQTPAAQVAAVLDDWHHAAAAADEARYFGHFAANGVFMGTDATERWTVSEFREWAKPQFQRKSAWSFKPRNRQIAFSADGNTAWFDEMLDTPNLGVCRGSGVLVRQSGAWKIAQYNLSVAIPNSIVYALVKQIAAAGNSEIQKK
jgi:hypothetical protein